MQHARIAIYHMNPGKSADEVYKRARAGMLPTFRQHPGFVGYGLVRTDDGKKVVSISFWETEKEAEAAIAVASDWVRDNIADYIGLEENHVGDLEFFESTQEVGAGS